MTRRTPSRGDRIDRGAGQPLKFGDRPGPISAGSAIATSVVWLVSGAVLGACPICFQVEQGPVTDGVRTAVIVLVAVTTGVLTGFGAFIVRFVRRARAVEAARTGAAAPVAGDHALPVEGQPA